MLAFIWVCWLLKPSLTVQGRTRTRTPRRSKVRWSSEASFSFSLSLFLCCHFNSWPVSVHSYTSKLSFHWSHFLSQNRKPRPRQLWVDSYSKACLWQHLYKCKSLYFTSEMLMNLTTIPAGCVMWQSDGRCRTPRSIGRTHNASYTSSAAHPLIFHFSPPFKGPKKDFKLRR